jgi:hypothetical protein
MHALTTASLVRSCSKKSPTTRRPAADRQIEAEHKVMARPAQDVVVPAELTVAGAPDDDLRRALTWRGTAAIAPASPTGAATVQVVVKWLSSAITTARG